MNGDEQNVLTEVIYDLAEIRSVARQFKADRVVTTSRASQLLRELHDSLLVMAGDMTHAKDSYYATNASRPSLDTFNAGRKDPRAKTFLSIPSTAQCGLDRNKAQEMRLQKNFAQQLTAEISIRIKARFRHK